MNATVTRASRTEGPWLKVPRVSLYFWVAKLLTTAMGEATSDFLVFHTNPYLAVMGCGVLFMIAIWLQMRRPHYSAPYYWFAVIMVSIFGTQIADVTHVVLHVPYAISTVTFFLALIGILTTWKIKEKTLSIHGVHTPRREAFYWATVIATFALGTAAGDMTASTLSLGYFASTLLFIVLFAIPVVAYLIFDLNEIAAFWIAYILTRPIGASFADWAGKPLQFGGLGLGSGVVSLTLIIPILLLLAFLVISRIDDPNHIQSPM